MLEQREVLVLRRLLSRQLSPYELDAVLAEKPPDVDDALARIPDSQSPDQTMRQVLQVCFADGALEPEEYDLIVKVARCLKISDEELETLREETASSR